MSYMDGMRLVKYDGTIIKDYSMNYTLQDIADRCYQIAEDKGWHKSKDQINIPERLALIHSEVSEALEDYRDGHMVTGLDNHKPIGFPTELGDIVIRVFDLCGELDINIEEELLTKMAYNETRPYRHGGKLA